MEGKEEEEKKGAGWKKRGEVGDEIKEEGENGVGQKRYEEEKEGTGWKKRGEVGDEIKMKEGMEGKEEEEKEGAGWKKRGERWEMR